MLGSSNAPEAAPSALGEQMQVDRAVVTGRATPTAPATLDVNRHVERATK